MSANNEKVTQLILETMKGKDRWRKAELLNDIYRRVAVIHGFTGSTYDVQKMVDGVVSARLRSLRNLGKIVLHKGKDQGPGGSWSLVKD